MKKLIAFLMSAMMCALMLAGCGGGADSSGSGTPAPSSENTPEAADPSEISTEGTGLSGDLELQIFLDGYGEKVWMNAIESFGEMHPDLNIITNMSVTVNEQMNTRWMNDDPPDFLYLGGGDLPVDQFIEDGKLMDLNEFFDTAEDEDGGLIKDKLLEGMLVPEQGGLYRAPILFNCWGVWYNDVLFQEHEVTVPNNFEEFMAAGEKFKEAGIPLFCYTGVYAVYLTRGFLQPALASEGGAELLNKVASSEDPEVYRSEPFKKVIQKFQDMIDSGYILDGTVALDHTASQMAWLNGQAAMIPNGLWLEAEMEKDIPAGFEMKFIPSVLQDATQKMTVNPQGVSVALAQNGKNPEAAKAFLKHMYTEQVLGTFVEVSGSPSAAQIDTSQLNMSATAKSVVARLSEPDVQLIPQNPINLPPDVEKAFTDAMNAMVR